MRRLLKSKKYWLLLIAIIFILINFYVYITDPFHTVTIVQNPYSTSMQHGSILLHKNFTIRVDTNPLLSFFALYKAGVHILANTYIGSHPAMGNSENQIIADIHTLRFNPTKPFLISGDHFSMLYPRNLGIFYASMLDPNTALNTSDWKNRQKIYLQTTAYALESFKNAHNVYTTIIPVGPKIVTPINIFAYPSDSLYGILYALDVMQNERFPANNKYPLQTQVAAKQLMHTYNHALQELLHVYATTAFDNKLGLIKQNIHLSSARDSVKRSSSFYDNVIYWKTNQLAQKLHIIPSDTIFLDNLKKRIIAHFWNEKNGYFLNDLSGKITYSSDWLIAVETEFLNPENLNERAYIEKSTHYILVNNIDKPFAIKYQKDSDPSDEFVFVRYFVPSYGQNAIWSYWGMAYIQTLLYLYRTTGNTTYLTIAGNNIAQYDENIVKYKGFPEVYNDKGEFLQNVFYKSIRQTGWVVGFEEVKWLYNQVSEQKPIAILIK